MKDSFYKKSETFLLQGSILAMAGIICRVIGLIYRIPMIAIIGTTGNGYYTSAYSIYSLFLILSSYSFPSAISKIISKNFATKRLLDVKHIISCSLKIAFLFGLIAFSIMFFGANIIANILQKPHLNIVLKVLAPTLFIMAILSVLRGVFQGMGNMIPTAISQIFEQVFNAIFSLVFAYTLFSKGIIANLIYKQDDYQFAYGAAGGAIGTGVGAFVALSILLYLFITFNFRYRQYLKYNNEFRPLSNHKIYQELFLTIVPILLSSTIYNISAVIDDTIFSNLMVLMRRKAEIISLWGVYGQYHILFNIPVAIANSLTSSVIPSISNSMSTRNGREVAAKIKYSIKYTLLIVLPAFIALTIFADPICRILFNGEDVEILINVLRIGAIAVVFFSLSTVTNGILQGMSRLKKPVENSIISLIIHIIILIILMLIFNLNIYAVIIANAIFALIVAILNDISIAEVIRYKKHYFSDYILPLICSLIMGVIGFVVYKFLNSIIQGISLPSLLIKLLISGVICLIVYIILIIVLGVVRKRDSEYIPFITKFYKYLQY